MNAAAVTEARHVARLFRDRLIYGEHFDEWRDGKRRCLLWTEGAQRRAARGVKSA